MTQGSFQFDSRARADELDREINDLLVGRSGQWPLSKEAADILRRIQFCKGASRARTIASLSQASGLNERKIKEVVSSLVIDYGLPIAGSRVPPYGYYLAITAEEIEDAIHTLAGELRTIGRRVRALGGSHRLHELLGQIELELNEGPQEAA